jgi:hypothetical protein
MSPLEEMLQEQKNLLNKGYSIEEIQCAATMLIGKLLMPTIMVQPETKDAKDADD